jgi:hypothetical protein
MRANAILLANMAYATPSVADSQLIDLGLLPRATRTPIQAPSDSPALHVDSVRERLVSFFVLPRDSNRRGKPYGAAGANLYSFVGDDAPTDLLSFQFQKMTTRAKTQLQLPSSVANGAAVWLTACWVSARGQTGPLCQPVCTHIQGGGVIVTRSLAA